MLVFGLQNSCMVHFFLLLPRFQNVVCFEKIAFKTYYILERRQYFFRHITLEKHSQNSGLETEKYQPRHALQSLVPSTQHRDCLTSTKVEHQLVGRKCHYSAKSDKFFKETYIFSEKNTNLGGLLALGEPWYLLTGDRAP
jgi:hypothetical protein